MWRSSQRYCTGMPWGCHPSELQGIATVVAHIACTARTELVPLLLGGIYCTCAAQSIGAHRESPMCRKMADLLRRSSPSVQHMCRDLSPPGSVWFALPAPRCTHGHRAVQEIPDKNVPVLVIWTVWIFTGLKIRGLSSTGATGIKGLVTSVFLNQRYSDTCALLHLHLPWAFISCLCSTTCWLLSCSRLPLEGRDHCPSHLGCSRHNSIIKAGLEVLPGTFELHPAKI